MAIEPLQTWKDELENMPKVDNPTWAINFANYVDEMIAGLTPQAAALDVSAGYSFTFDKTLFAAQLATMAPTPDPVSGITALANAFLASITSPLTLFAILPGAFVPPSTPATLFSVVAPTILNPATPPLLHAKLLELIASSPVDSAQDSEFPIKFREAVLLLGITVNGTNSVVPVPAPLVLPLVPQ